MPMPKPRRKGDVQGLGRQLRQLSSLACCTSALHSHRAVRGLLENDAIGPFRVQLEVPFLKCQASEAVFSPTCWVSGHGVPCWRKRSLLQGLLHRVSSFFCVARFVCHSPEINYMMSALKLELLHPRSCQAHRPNVDGFRLEVELMRIMPVIGPGISPQLVDIYLLILLRGTCTCPELRAPSGLRAYLVGRKTGQTSTD